MFLPTIQHCHDNHLQGQGLCGCFRFYTLYVLYQTLVKMIYHRYRLYNSGIKLLQTS